MVRAGLLRHARRVVELAAAHRFLALEDVARAAVLKSTMRCQAGRGAPAAAFAAAGSASRMRLTATSSCAAERNQAS